MGAPPLHARLCLPSIKTTFMKHLYDGPYRVSIVATTETTQYLFTETGNGKHMENKYREVTHPCKYPHW